MTTLKFEKVPSWRQMSALRFLVAGDERDELVEVQARTLRHQIQSGLSSAAHLWWARRWPRRLAAALVLQSPGRTGMLFSSPAEAPGVDPVVLVRLVSQLCGDLLAGGLTLVQALLPCDAQADAAVLRQASFEHLANLSYMRLDLSKTPQAADPDAELPDDAHVEWKTFGQYSEGQLIDLIRATYADSLDCPALDGVRRLSDVVAGHKASGIFRPQSWYIAHLGGRPGGCLLMNDSFLGRSGEVVYMGVAREFRGRGLGRKLISRAAADARSRGLSALTLAVDTQNSYALKVYEQSGFVLTQSRCAFVRFAARA